MAIEYGDIMLNDDTNVYGTSDGDLSTGDNREHQIGAIMNAGTGNFRKHPTLATDLAKDLDGPVNSRQIASKLQNAAFLDGWELLDLSIVSDGEETTINILDCVKNTDDTDSLI